MQPVRFAIQVEFPELRHDQGNQPGRDRIKFINQQDERAIPQPAIPGKEFVKVFPAGDGWMPRGSADSRSSPNSTGNWRVSGGASLIPRRRPSEK